MTGYSFTATSDRDSCAKAPKMSMLSAAALLDELMGVDRDRAPNEKKTALHWSDPQVSVIKRMAKCKLLLPYSLVPSFSYITLKIL